MITTRRQFVSGIGIVGASMLAACGNQAQESSSASSSEASANEASTSALTLDSAAWQYNSDDDVYYQIGISYCENPADADYEKLAIFVPGAYFTATDNGNDTFTCEINASGTVESFTPKTAPIVMPINTPGYSAQSALTEYTSCADYTGKGFVYVHAGCRGRDHGAPAGVTDLKAAVRYLRLVAEQLPADVERIFTFGMSGGGAQSALMGATGDAPEYEPYLQAIGAADNLSDSILGSMDWCPITNLDSADAAYEWMMGCTRSDLSEEDQKVSDGLAAAFATYVNAAQIKDEEGATLELEDSSDGIYQAGSYYDRVKKAIETSLNDFLSDTEFPYDADSASSGGMGGGMGGPGGGNGGPGDGEMPSGEMPSGEMPSGEMPSGEMPSGEKPDFANGEGPDGAGSDSTSTDGTSTTGDGEAPSGEAPDASSNADSASTDGETSIEDVDQISRNSGATALVSISGTFDTAADYIAALNGTDELGEWVTYDESSNTATISSVEAFVRAFKPVSKDLGAFDQYDSGQGENTLFGYGDGSGAHFDEILATVLDELDSEYAADFAEDLAKTDDQGNTPVQRVAMYTPLYYLLESQGGYQTSNPAKYWRIRSGIAQSDTALTTELNLSMALQNDERVESVDFAAVWGQQHTEAERTGNSTDNFVTWVGECLK